MKFATLVLTNVTNSFEKNRSEILSYFQKIALIVPLLFSRALLLDVFAFLYRVFFWRFTVNPGFRKTLTSNSGDTRHFYFWSYQNMIMLFILDKRGL